MIHYIIQYNMHILNCSLNNAILKNNISADSFILD